MIHYKDNPNLGLKTIITFDGVYEYRHNCKKIKHKYYIKNKDCFMVGETWYRLDSGLIIKDFELNSYVLKKNINSMVKGVVKINSDGTEEYGFFTPNELKNIYIKSKYSSIVQICISLDVIECPFQESFSEGIYYIEPSGTRIYECKRIQNVVNNQDNTYNIEDNLSQFENAINQYNINEKNINKYCKIYAKGLGNITFGVELETIRGYLPKHIMSQNGTLVCRDGSLRDENGTQGAEFTTIPLKGEKGIQTIIDLCKALSFRTKIDKQCALHIHVGGFDTSKNFLVALWTLCKQIQEDVFLMFPFSKQNEIEYAGKNKNYCQKLPNLLNTSFRNNKASTYREYIDYSYNRIFNFLSEGYTPCVEYNRKNKRHPKKHKWERHKRYFWVNFMNSIFSDRNTIEFRIHQGTKNPQKIITWLFICNAIIKFAKRNMTGLIRGKKYTFIDVLNVYCDCNAKNYNKSLSNYLIQYYNFMKTRFDNMRAKGDYIGLEDTETDDNFYFGNQLSTFTKMF